MRRTIDFVLSEDKYRRVIFRIYLNRTYVHSFGDHRPENWEAVYKVYYRWSIIHQYLNTETGEIEQTYRPFVMDYDEFSIIPNLGYIIEHMIATGEEFSEPTIGQPAADWTVKQVKGFSGWYNKDYEYYTFIVFDNYINNGYKFHLNRDKAEEFAKWLHEAETICLEKCGCPI